MSTTPALRIGGHAAGPRLVLEMGAGFHYLSVQKIGCSARRRHVIPARRSACDGGGALHQGHPQALVARIEHISNGGLETPGNSINLFLPEYRHNIL